MKNGTSSSFDFRPETDSHVIVMFLSPDGVEMVDGVVAFDRGRGIIIAVESVPAESIKAGGSAMIAFDKAGVMQCLTCTVDEILTDRKYYLVPRGEVRHLEAREYLREITTLPFSVGVTAEVSPRTPGAIELSGSGFRFLTESSFSTSDRLYVTIEPVPGHPVVLQGVVLRSTPRHSRYEVAGRFDHMDAETREMILDIVFKARFKSLGLADS